MYITLQFLSMISFQRHVDGVVSVGFAEVEPADVCIRVRNILKINNLLEMILKELHWPNDPQLTHLYMSRFRPNCEFSWLNGEHNLRK